MQINSRSSQQRDDTRDINTSPVATGPKRRSVKDPTVRNIFVFARLFSGSEVEIHVESGSVWSGTATGTGASDGCVIVYCILAAALGTIWTGV